MTYLRIRSFPALTDDFPSHHLISSNSDLFSTNNYFQIGNTVGVCMPNMLSVLLCAIH